MKNLPKIFGVFAVVAITCLLVQSQPTPQTISVQPISTGSGGSGSFNTNAFYALNVWTNAAGVYIYPNGFGTVDTSGATPGPGFFIRKDGSFFGSTNVTQDISVTDYSKINFPYFVTMTDSNEPARVNGLWQAVNNENYNFYSSVSLSTFANKDSPNVFFSLYTQNTNSQSGNLQFTVDTVGTSPIVYKKNNVAKLTVTTDGNIGSGTVDANAIGSQFIYTGSTNSTTNYRLRGDGSIYIGKNAGSVWNLNSYSGPNIGLVSMVNSNEPADQIIELQSIGDQNFDYYSQIGLEAKGNKDLAGFATLNIERQGTNTLNQQRIQLSTDPSDSFGIRMQNSNTTVMTITRAGNITKVNGVASSWPSTQGGANTFLKNDGAGNYSWATAVVDGAALTNLTITNLTVENITVLTNLIINNNIVAKGNSTVNIFSVTNSLDVTNVITSNDIFASNGIVTITHSNNTANATVALAMTNKIIAAAGTQMQSPSLELDGNGWKTTATAASQPVGGRITVIPVQQASSPSVYIRLGTSTNNSGYKAVADFSADAGQTNTGQFFAFGGGALLTGPSGGSVATFESGVNELKLKGNTTLTFMAGAAQAAQFTSGLWQGAGTDGNPDVFTSSARARSFWIINQERKTADTTSTSVSLATTGLSAPTLTGSRVYSFDIILYFTNSVAADGLAIDFNGGSATATGFRCGVIISDTSGVVKSAQVSALNTAITVATITGDTMAVCHAMMEVNAGGTFIPRFAVNSHSTGTLTCYKYSHINPANFP